MKKVITYGTFDLLHYGHINLLRRAKELGDYLIVAVSSDAFNKLKGKESFFNLEQRIEMLKAIRYVDEIIIEKSWEQKVKDIKDNEISIFVMGDDWVGKFDYLNSICQVVYLTRTPEVSTTSIKQKLRK